jgi:hypothetical protein
MEPSDLYNKNKRNLAVFAGILILLMAGSLEANDAATTLFPFRIVDPSIFELVIFGICVFCLYQFWLSWSFQPDQTRDQAHVRRDFQVTVGLASLEPFWNELNR